MLSIHWSRLIALALFLCALVFLPRQTLAQGPPIHTDTPIMLGLEGGGVRTFLKVVRKDKLLEDGNETSDPMDRTVTAYVSPIVIPYNLATTFQVGAVLPIVTKELNSSGAKKIRTGVGDAAVFAKKLLVQVDRRMETFRVALKGTAKLPTGDDETPVPLGTGSFDYGASAVAGWIKGRWGIYAESIYFHNTSNGDVDYGDRLGYNMAVGFRVLPAVYERYPSPQLNAFLELNGNTLGRTRMNGTENPDSGGTELFLSPGLQFVGGRRWLVETSAQLPVVNEPNGTQLATSWVATIGARVLLF